MRLRSRSVVAAASLGLLASLIGCSESDFASGADGVQKSDKDKDDDDDDDDDDDGGGPGGPNTLASSGTQTNGDALGGIGTDGDNGAIGGINNGVDAGNGTGTDIGIGIDEGGITIPGLPVERVGVNFEDQGLRGDRDHNDAVMCFTGAFKVEATNVVSAKAQQVVGTTFSASGCDHTVRVEIIHSDGTKEPPISFDSSDVTPVTMNFRRGSKLEVYMTARDAGCDQGQEKNMHNPVDCVVAPNVCNNSGG